MPRVTLNLDEPRPVVRSEHSHGMNGRVREIEPDWQAWNEISPWLKPVRVEGADWQPRIIEGSERFRVYLDGEPIPATIAASTRSGWVDYVTAPRLSCDGEDGQTGGIITRLTGRVELRPDRL